METLTPAGIELDQRTSDGITVTLLWFPTANMGAGQTRIDVYDAREDLQLNFPVPQESAWDAFHHPYAYAPEQATL